jgi:hypothetical protein
MVLPAAIDGGGCGHPRAWASLPLTTALDRCALRSVSSRLPPHTPPLPCICYLPVCTGWAACYSDLLSLYGDAKSIAVTALDLWRRGVRQPLPLLGHLAAHHALVATFFATVYAWAALALSGPLLGVGWAIHTWVPKTWVTGVTLDLVYLAWLLGVRRLRPVVSQVLLGAMVQLRQVSGAGREGEGCLC